MQLQTIQKKGNVTECMLNFKQHFFAKYRL